eukprot:TRINITY_DN4084_c0_g1_i5.p1 TRINITY_DN4084_c0_g1~~TRINITY_DN4084_c0_g1_i5.p1  ORF type:complete len:1322 (+),score=230.17 TRINITY_DN4084_c0_g1_i5:3-3968(+)
MLKSHTRQRSSKHRTAGPALGCGLKHGALRRWLPEARRWARAWVVLRLRELTVGDCQGGGARPEDTTTVCVVESVVEPDAGASSHEFAFVLTTTDAKTITLAAANSDELESWVTAIKVVAKLRVTVLPAGNDDALLKDLTALLDAADAVVPLLGAEATNDTGARSMLKLAEEIGCRTLAVINAAPTAIQKRTSGVAQKLCTILVQLATCAANVERVFNLSPSSQILLHVSNLVSAASNVVTQLAAKATTVDQIQASYLLACKVASGIARETTANGLPEQVRALRSICTNVTCLASKVAEETNNDLPTFIAPLLPSLCGEAQYHAVKLQQLAAATQSTEQSQQQQPEPEQAQPRSQQPATEIQSQEQNLAQPPETAQAQPIATTAVQPESSSAQSLKMCIADICGTLAKLATLCTAARNESMAASRSLASAINEANSLVKEIESLPSMDASFSRVVNTFFGELTGISMTFKESSPAAIPSAKARLVQATSAFQTVVEQLGGMGIGMGRLLGDPLSKFITASHTFSATVEAVAKSVADALRFYFALSVLAEAALTLLKTFVDATHVQKRFATKQSTTVIISNTEKSPLLLESTESITPTPTNTDADAENAKEGDGQKEEQGINIWDEPADNAGNFIPDTEFTIRAANLNKLVEHLTLAGKTDITLQKTFITTYRSFTTPELLFEKLLQRYHHRIPKLPPCVSPEEYRKHTVVPVQLRTINVMKHWLETSFFDFSDELVEKVQAFISKELARDGHTSLGKQLKKVIEDQLQERKRQQEKEKVVAVVADNACPLEPESSPPLLPPAMETNSPLLCAAVSPLSSPSSTPSSPSTTPRFSLHSESAPNSPATSPSPPEPLSPVSLPSPETLSSPLPSPRLIIPISPEAASPTDDSSPSTPPEALSTSAFTPEDSAAAAATATEADAPAGTETLRQTRKSMPAHSPPAHPLPAPPSRMSCNFASSDEQEISSGSTSIPLSVSSPSISSFNQTQAPLTTTYHFTAIHRPAISSPRLQKKFSVVGLLGRSESMVTASSQALEREKRTLTLRRRKTQLPEPTSPPLLAAPNAAGTHRLTVADFFWLTPPEVLAKQLTYLDFHLYSSIKPVELLNQSWNKDALKHRAPNVLAMAARFNATSSWAATRVISPQKADERAAAWVKLIKVAEHLYRLNNFSTLLAILSGLSTSPVHRLRLTRSLVPPTVLTWQEAKLDLMQQKGSYKEYRKALHHSNPPCLPYLGVHLTDLTFIEGVFRQTPRGATRSPTHVRCLPTRLHRWKQGLRRRAHQLPQASARLQYHRGGAALSAEAVRDRRGRSRFAASPLPRRCVGG